VVRIEVVVDVDVVDVELVLVDVEEVLVEVVLVEVVDSIILGLASEPLPLNTGRFVLRCTVGRNIPFRVLGCMGLREVDQTLYT